MSLRSHLHPFIAYLAAVAATSTATAIEVAVNHVVHIPNISLLYLPAILLIAVSFGTGPSLLAALLAILQYDFFLLKPLFTFTIFQAEDILALVTFSIVAVLTSELAVRARARDAERRRLAVADESDRLKTALLNAVSHDLRTPLAVIKTAASSLLLPDARWSAGEGHDLLETIDHEADRLNRLVGNLLDLSRIEAGVLRPALDWYDVSEVGDAVVRRLRPLVGSHRLDVRIVPSHIMVRLDLLRVEELVINLVENAVRYTAPTHPIELRIRNDAEALHLEVADHGMGVAESDRDHIFDAFYRREEHSDRGYGTGLGLAICRGIAQAHGGTIEVRETPGGGATFVVVLPLQPVPAPVPS